MYLVINTLSDDTRCVISLLSPENYVFRAFIILYDLINFLKKEN